jgi:hypothetical protein
MHGPWTPSLNVRELDRGCRLSLGGLAYGDGATLQEAGNALVARVVALAVACYRAGVSIPAEGGPPDMHWLDFLYEVGEIAARGGDVRARVLGLDPEDGA